MLTINLISFCPVWVSFLSSWLFAVVFFFALWFAHYLLSLIVLLLPHRNVPSRIFLPWLFFFSQTGLGAVCAMLSIWSDWFWSTSLLSCLVLVPDVTDAGSGMGPSHRGISPIVHHARSVPIWVTLTLKAVLNIASPTWRRPTLQSSLQSLQFLIWTKLVHPTTLTKRFRHLQRCIPTFIFIFVTGIGWISQCLLIHAEPQQKLQSHPQLVIASLFPLSTYQLSLF